VFELYTGPNYLKKYGKVRFARVCVSHVWKTTIIWCYNWFMSQCQYFSPC